MQKGILAGLPVIVEDDPETDTVWIASANKYVAFLLDLYMESDKFDEDTPVYIYEGNYFEGLIGWLTTPRGYDDDE